MFSIKSKTVRRLEGEIDRLIKSFESLREEKKKASEDACHYSEESRKLADRVLELEKNLAAKNTRISDLDGSLSSMWDEYYKLSDKIKQIELENQALERDLNLEKESSSALLNRIRGDQKRVDELEALMKTWKHKAELWKDASCKALRALNSAADQDDREKIVDVTGYTPKIGGKCMADLPPSDRLKCATRCEHPEFSDPGSLEREMEFKPWSLPSE